MDFIVKRIWYITIPTAMAVLVFQLYWLHNTYLNQQLDFKQTATNSLQKAYDATVLETFGSKKIFSASNTSVSVDLKSDKSKDNDIKEGDIKESDIRKMLSLPKDSNQKFLKVNDKDIDLNRFFSDIMSASSLVKLNQTALNKNYQKELKTRGIVLPFKLKLHKDTKLGADTTAATSIWLKIPGKKDIITAQFTGLTNLLIFKIVWPILLSFLLVVLITGCIWILWRIIHQQKKLEAMKNDFISNISHELKTPLSILTTTNDVLLNFEGMKDPEKTERYLKLSKGELNKLQSLIDGILALTKIEHTHNQLGPFEKVNLEDLLKAIASRFKELPGISIELDLKISQKSTKTWPEALKTIISNLLDNAIKYTVTPEKHIKLTVTEDPRFYWISVIDQGIGIAEHQQAFIFDKFFRVPHGNIHNVKGYGLGLSHVKGLSQKIEAKISVRSKLGEGSVFTIQLKKNG